MTEVQLLLVNPLPAVSMGLGLSGLTTAPDSAILPVAPGSARAVALDRNATPGLVLAAADILRPGGRLVAPELLPVPDGLTELARDDRVWVAEQTAGVAAANVIRLERRR
jgi:hypothetical protein